MKCRPKHFKAILTQLIQLTWTSSANSQQCIQSTLFIALHTSLHHTHTLPAVFVSYSLLDSPISVHFLSSSFFAKFSFGFPPYHFHSLFSFLLKALLLYSLVTLLLVMAYSGLPSFLLFLLPLLLPPPHTSVFSRAS